MNIELRHLRCFIAVAEESSFTGAARRTHVAQQVLSAQVRQLEDALGAQLRERTSRGAALTPAGAAFLETAWRADDASPVVHRFIEVVAARALDHLVPAGGRSANI